MLQLVVRCIRNEQKVRDLQEINLRLEELRVLSRLVQKRGWIGLAQMDYAKRCVDEAVDAVDSPVARAGGGSGPA